MTWLNLQAEIAGEFSTNTGRGRMQANESSLVFIARLHACEMCEAKYRPKKPWQRFCGEKCSIRYHSTRRGVRRARARTRLCANPKCGKRFSRKSGCARYCTHACGDRHRSLAYYYRVRRVRLGRGVS